MTNQTILDWINQSKNKKSETEIKDELLKHGWKLEEINDAIDVVFGRKIPTSPQNTVKKEGLLGRRISLGKGIGCLFLGLFLFLGSIWLFASCSNEKEKVTEPTLTIPEKQITEEEQARLQKQKDDEITNYAQKYCDNRKDWHRNFPLLDKTSIGIKVEKGSYKMGNELTIDDCKRNISALYENYQNDLQKIVEGKYWIGMKEMILITSVGSPDDRNDTVSVGHENSQYVYRKDKYGINAIYIYVDDGVVTSYQDF